MPEQSKALIIKLIDAEWHQRKTLDLPCTSNLKLSSANLGACSKLGYACRERWLSGFTHRVQVCEQTWWGSEPQSQSTLVPETAAPNSLLTAVQNFTLVMKVWCRWESNTRLLGSLNPASSVLTATLRTRCDRLQFSLMKEFVLFIAMHELY